MRTSLLLLLALTACSENQIVQKDGLVDDVDDGSEPDIEVEPASINFGSVDVSSGEPVVETVVVRNVGTAALELQDLTLEDATAPYTLSAFGAVLLQPGEETQFTVTFDPQTAEARTTRVLIDNNDPDEDPALVDLTGDGVAPAIQIDPATYDFGVLYIGCGDTVPITISNVGNADLRVTEFEYTTGSPDEIGFDQDIATNDVLPWTIAPGDSRVVYVAYDPLNDRSDDAYLTVYSNDPLQPDARAQQVGTGAVYGENADLFDQPIRGETDIIFTLDWSGSMSDDIALVQSNFDVFLATLAEMDADYHVSAVVRDSGCAVGDVPFLDSSMSPDEQQDLFDVLIGDSGSAGGYTEMGFTILEAAFTETNLESGGCNEGMIRDDATLAIVGVTDEPEQSLNPYSYYVSLFQGMKSDPDDVIMHAIAGDYPRGCGSATAGTGWYEATVATGGLFLSICATDWASHLEALAEGSAANLSRFELTQWPVPETITVRINGTRVTEGWEYNETPNSVDFDDDHVPEGGSTIEVEYMVSGDCER